MATSQADILTILEDVQLILANLASDTTSLRLELATLQTSVNALAAGQRAIEDQIQAAFSTLSQQLADGLAAIEADVNPQLPLVPPLQFWSPAAMAFVTAINPTVAVPSSVICQDSSSPPQNIPGSQISWVLTGLASQSDVTMTLGTDGETFTFTPSSTAPTESATATATWNPPMGNTQPSFAGTLTVNLVAAVVVPPPEVFVPPMQFELTAGA
jgi:hypothetical protein